MAEDEERRAPPETAMHELGAPPVDISLRMFVDISNQSGMEIGVTLNVRGTLVTGILIPYYVWLETIGAQFASGFEDEGVRAAIRGSYERLAREEKASQDAREDGEKQHVSEDEPWFIHLRGARVLTPEGFIGTDDTIWRGRLSEVEGFFLGVLGQDAA